tara:strand:- start:2197 stop:2772 length:576 start_codon:yes stop_codon:yes gene_type:complete
MSLGSLEIIMGPMFSGKTTELCRRVRRLECTTHPLLIVNHDSDTRYGNSGQTLTHDKAGCASVPVSKLRELQDKDEYKKAFFIFINEAQFFEDLVPFVYQAVEKDAKQVVVFGLDGDFKRKAFGSILELIPLANSVQKLAAVCKLCGDGTPALFTKRIVSETKQHLVGGDDMYMAVCRKHYHEELEIKKDL